jgi:crotonobetainyl-CoA:carnitine CoA-transferase CaiB-like acyl-CoA transferase
LLPITVEDGRVMNLPGFPVALDGERLGLRRNVPGLGEHTAEILEEIGLGPS